ncbi:DUF4041 domain-containing protein [Allobranchiibius sp. GilTou73]|uniref:DUF4041 domain-containing protein n=1 Tax=Allobranchiibius sp. GilTou73 TaxID=2904523 RepID=UPI001F24AA45|nr:DUF4041 domain-containing protein [Allobranchiibius sp. GilTou73]UIJ35316.1 DUF4041 domain-containing protein [Allobranchiibius sp. GilTou73]
MTEASATASTLRALEADIAARREELVELDDQLTLQRVGVYYYRHPLDNSPLYKEALTELREHIKDSIKQNDAVVASDSFVFNNSLALGRKMVADYAKLMLRAFNAEADASVRSLRAGGLETGEARLQRSADAIARLGRLMEIRISESYFNLRKTELELTADYLMKVQEEREQEREERARLREERLAERELAAEREKLNKERDHNDNVYKQLIAQGRTEEAERIRQQIASIDAAIAQNDYRVANIRAGFVYVISNIGAFGANVVKIGMTRRLEPMDRVRELGDASVPFPFDVHIMYFSKDAITLETQLHQAFAERKLNNVNLRREFFFATPAEVKKNFSGMSERSSNTSILPPLSNFCRVKEPGRTTVAHASSSEI